MKVWGWISIGRSFENAFIITPLRKHNDKLANWAILEFQMKKWSPKSDSMWKLSKIGSFEILIFSQWSMQKAKVNNGQESKYK